MKFRRYKPIVIGTCCTYCAGPAQCRDHYQPHSSFYQSYCVPGCRDCNTALSSSSQSTFSDRCKFLLVHYQNLLKSQSQMRHYEKMALECTGGLQQYFANLLTAAIEIARKVRSVRSAMIVSRGLPLDSLHSNDRAKDVLSRLANRT